MLKTPDRLAALLSRFELRARVFNSGALCQITNFDAAQGVGHVHVLARGAMRVETPGEPTLELREPTLLFYPQPTMHRFIVDDPGGADTVCASIHFGAHGGNPLVTGLPRLVVAPLAALPGLAGTIELLFGEAFAARCGRQTALDRLSELLVIQLLRHLMDTGRAQAGLLAGLADPRLSRALIAMHDAPAHEWSLEALAASAGMSRARFAVNFRETVGVTPGEYLARWRLGLAQSLLRRGKPVALVASEVGYSGAAALARAFNVRYGAAPREWLKYQNLGKRAQ